MQKKYLYFTLSIFIAIVISLCVFDGVKTFFGTLISGLVPFIVALFIAYVLDHAVGFFEKVYFNIGIKDKIQRFLSVISAILSLLIVLTLLAIFGLPSLIENGKDFVSNLPKYEQKIATFLKNATELLNLPIDLSTYDITAFFDQQDLTQTISSFIPQAFNVISTLSISILLAVMILLEKNNIKKAVFSFVKRVSSCPEKIKTGFNCIKVVLDGYFWGKALECVVTGLLFVALYYVIGVPYPIFLGIIMSLLVVIPYVGGYFALVPAVIFALDVSTIATLSVLIGGIALLNIVGTFLSPLIFKNTINISALTTISSVLIGGSLAGIIGFLLAPPIAGLIKLFLSAFIKSKNRKSS